jgi:hypothetical protein
MHTGGQMSTVLDNQGVGVLLFVRRMGTEYMVHGTQYWSSPVRDETPH